MAEYEVQGKGPFKYAYNPQMPKDIVLWDDGEGKIATVIQRNGATTNSGVAIEQQAILSSTQVGNKGYSGNVVKLAGNDRVIFSEDPQMDGKIYLVKPSQQRQGGPDKKPDTDVPITDARLNVLPTVPETLAAVVQNFTRGHPRLQVNGEEYTPVNKEDFGKGALSEHKINHMVNGKQEVATVEEALKVRNNVSFVLNGHKVDITYNPASRSSLPTATLQGSGGLVRAESKANFSVQVDGVALIVKANGKDVSRFSSLDDVQKLLQESRRGIRFDGVTEVVPDPKNLRPLTNGNVLIKDNPDGTGMIRIQGKPEELAAKLPDLAKGKYVSDGLTVTFDPKLTAVVLMDDKGNNYYARKSGKTGGQEYSYDEAGKAYEKGTVPTKAAAAVAPAKAEPGKNIGKVSGENKPEYQLRVNSGMLTVVQVAADGKAITAKEATYSPPTNDPAAIQNVSMLLQNHLGKIAIDQMKTGGSFTFPPGSKIDTVVRDSSGKALTDQTPYKDTVAQFRAVGDNVVVAPNSTIVSAKEVATTPATPATPTTTPPAPTPPAAGADPAIQKLNEAVTAFRKYEKEFYPDFSKDHTRGEKSAGHVMHVLEDLSKKPNWTPAELDTAKEFVRRLGVVSNTIIKHDNKPSKAVSREVMKPGSYFEQIKEAVEQVKPTVTTGMNVDGQQEDIANKLGLMAKAAVVGANIPPLIEHTPAFMRGDSQQQTVLAQTPPAERQGVKKGGFDITNTA